MLKNASDLIHLLISYCPLCHRYLKQTCPLAAGATSWREHDPGSWGWPGPLLRVGLQPPVWGTDMQVTVTEKQESPDDNWSRLWDRPTGRSAQRGGRVATQLEAGPARVRAQARRDVSQESPLRVKAAPFGLSSHDGQIADGGAGPSMRSLLARVPILSQGPHQLYLPSGRPNSQKHPCVEFNMNLGDTISSTGF